MGYRLRRHPFAVSAHFRHSLVLAYALPASSLEPLLPPTLEPDRHGDLGFAAAAFVQTERMRPSLFPSALGFDFFLGGYRIFVRVAGRPSLRGLYILRSDTDRRLLTFFGNLFTSYRYRTVDAGFRLDGELLKVEVRPGVNITADLGHRPGPLPPDSPFGTVEEARPFAGPLPYTFHHEQKTGRLLSVRGTRSSWDPQPVAVEVCELDFFSAGRFSAEPILANAFHVSDVDYRWERGRLV
ncbi:MAG TPA: DUF2071 domain-containing protein [Gaiellaceae bacterium]|jgi:hypothetical protein|nr:DUF2071 domain-containing protein [Gaiellaceae bacterium]